MNKIEAVRLALKELGEVTDANLVAFVQNRYGVKLELKMVPVIRATLRGMEMMAAARVTVAGNIMSATGS
jgi:hypothetical protein